MNMIPLRGRRDSLGEATALVKRVRRLRRGNVLLVTGDAGIGKSAFISAIAREAATFRIGATKTHESGGPGETLFAALGSGRAPLLGPAALSELTALTERPLQLLEHTSAALGRLAEGGPVLILIDDVQWSDRLSRFLLRSLPARLTDRPILWVLSSRDPGIDVIRDLRSQSVAEVPVTHLELAPLSTADLATIAQDRLGQVPSNGVRDMLARLGGNPFLAVQMLESVSRGPDGGLHHAPLEFTASIRNRLATLAPGPADVLRLAAVLARPFGYHEPREILGPQADAASARAVDGAVRSGLLLTGDHRVEFRHDLIREAIYADLPPADRDRMHRQCATYYLDVQDDTVAAAEHLRTVARIGDQDAAEVLVRAAEQAVAAQPDLAGELACDAFALLPAGSPSRITLGRRCLAVLNAVQRHADVVALADEILVLHPAAQRPPAPPAPVAVAAELDALAANALFVTGRAADADTRIAAALAQDGIPAGLRARLRAGQALAATRIATSETAGRLAAEALQTAREVADRPALVTALTATYEVHKNAGRHASTLAAARELRVSAGASYLSQEIMALQLTDRFAEAQTMLDAAYQDASNHVEAVLPSLVLARMWQDFWLCRWDGAQRAAQELATIGRELGSQVDSVDGLSILSVSALFRGDVDLARTHFDALLDCHEIDDEYRQPRMTLIHGWIRASEGRPEEAARLLRPLMRTASQSRAHWPWWPGWMRTIAQIGLLAHDQGLVRDALAVAEEGAARNPGVASFEGLAGQLAGLVHDDVAVLRRATAQLATGPREILTVTSEKDLGRALLARGAPAEGLTHLRSAAERYSRLGMPRAAAAVSRTIAEHGGAATGDRTEEPWLALTAAEQRVARLIARGYTNRQAATELHLSPNTVGSHVRSTFSKLGVRSRVQLSNLLQDSGVLDAPETADLIAFS